MPSHPPPINLQPSAGGGFGQVGLNLGVAGALTSAPGVDEVRRLCAMIATSSGLVTFSSSKQQGATGGPLCSRRLSSGN